MTMDKTVCSNILETIGQIDILVGLALGNLRHEELDMLTMTDTNVQGLMAVTRCFLAFYGSSQSRSYYQYGIDRRNLCLCWGNGLLQQGYSSFLQMDCELTRHNGHQGDRLSKLFSTVRFHGDKERAATGSIRGIEEPYKKLRIRIQ